MKIVFVLDRTIRASSYDPLAFAEALHDVYHVDAYVVAPGYQGSGNRRYFKAICLAELECTSYWAEQKADLVVGFLYWITDRVVSAIKRGGSPLALWLDSTGQFGSYERYALRLKLICRARGSLAGRARQLKALVHSIIFAGKSSQRIASLLLAADYVTIESIRFKHNLLASFVGEIGAAIAPKVRVIPHAAKTAFTSRAIESKQAGLVVGACRWDDPVKNAKDWGECAREVARRDGTVQFVACGAAGIGDIREDIEALPNVRATGRLSEGDLASVFGAAEILFSTSYSETLPIVALEALSMGATIVAPPIEGFKALEPLGGCIRLASSSNRAALIRALTDELAQWRAKRRNAHAIAAVARQEFQLTSVAKQWALLGEEACTADPSAETAR